MFEIVVHFILYTLLCSTPLHSALPAPRERRILTYYVSLVVGISSSIHPLTPARVASILSVVLHKYLENTEKLIKPDSKFYCNSNFHNYSQFIFFGSAALRRRWSERAGGHHITSIA